MLDHLRIEMRLQRRACLPPRIGAVDLRGGGFEADAADIGEHVAGGVVEHDDGTVADAVGAEPGELAAQRDDRGGLDTAVDGGDDALAGLVEQARCEVRRERRVEARRLLARDERRGGGVDGGAVCRLRDSARALAERVGFRGGIGQEAREQRGVGAVHLGGFLAEQALRPGGDPLRLAAQREEVEIGFEHLRVRPARR